MTHLGWRKIQVLVMRASETDMGSWGACGSVPDLTTFRFDLCGRITLTSQTDAEMDLT